MSLNGTVRLGSVAAGWVLVAVTLAGCAKSAGGGGDAAQIAAGKAVFDTNGCANCHAVAGQGGGKAPDLTRVGADPGHTPQWLAEHVKNPKAHNPGSRMPAFEGKIAEADLAALGVYLASLK